MEQIHLEAKIRKPKLTEYFIERKCLLEKLENSSEKLVVFHATMGYGKTVLMNMYGSSCQKKQAWYHLSSTDNDVMLFLEYLTASVKQELPDFSFDPQAVGEFEFKNETCTKIGQDFSFALQKSLKGQEFYLMLDDFQDIASEKIYEILASMLGALPTGAHIYITSRGTMPQFALRLLLNGEALVLSAGDLCFDVDEIARVLKTMDSVKNKEETARIIHEYTQGWPAGVMLLCLYLKTWKKEVGRENIEDICKKARVHDFIMYEFFKKLSFEIQQFLVHTSVLEYLQSSVCNTVAQVTNAGSILDYLISEGIFIQKIENEVNTYRYHQLFRNFLLSQMDGREREIYYERAAAYYLKTDEKEQAVEYAIAARNRSVISLALETTGDQLLKTGKLQLLRTWIDAANRGIEADELSARVLLVEARYWKFVGDPEKGGRLLETALNKAKIHEPEGVYLQILSEKMEWCLERGDWAAVLKETKRGTGDGIRPVHKNWLPLRFQRLKALIGSGIMDEARVLSQKLSGKGEGGLAAEAPVLRKIRQSAGWINRAISSKKGEWDSLMKELGSRSAEPETWDILASYKMSDFIKRMTEEKGEEALKLDGAETELAAALMEVRPVSASSLCGHLAMACWQFKTKQYEEAEAGFHHILSVAPGFFDRPCGLSSAAWEEISQIMLAMESGYHGGKDQSHLFFNCFGNFRAAVLETGDVIRWRTRKAQECIAFLVLHAKDSFTREELMAVLWEVDELPSNEVAAFHNLLSSIRKSLSPYGLENLVEYDGKCYFLNQSCLYSDLNRADRLLVMIGAEDGEQLSGQESCLEHYILHPFLSEIGADWAREQRAYYEIRFCRGLYILGRWYERAGRYEKAEHMFKRAMELSPYMEEAQIALLELYGNRGELGKLKRIYDDIRGVWEREMGGVSGKMSKTYMEIVKKCQNL